MNGIKGMVQVPASGVGVQAGRAVHARFMQGRLMNTPELRRPCVYGHVTRRLGMRLDRMGLTGVGLGMLALAAPLLPSHSTVHAQAPERAAAWRVVADVPLPGRPARFDYQSFDPTTGRLWIAHMGAGELLAFDVRTRQVVARVPNMPGATGILVVPTLQRVFASLSGAHAVAVLDAATGQVLARVPGGQFPDGLAYAPAAQKVFVSDEYGKQELVIDVASSTARPPIAMGGEVGNTQYDSAIGRLWVAVQTRNELAAIDPATDSIVARVPLSGIVGPHGFIVNPEQRRIYVTGESNARLGVLDLRTMRVVGFYPVGSDPDVLALDPAQRRLYVATESGVVSAFDVRGDSLAPLPPYRAPHAHTVAVDPATHLLYLPLENVNGRPVLRILALGRP
jgi:DNA-binding beta-propeller fold protein YncE